MQNKDQMPHTGLGQPNDALLIELNDEDPTTDGMIRAVFTPPNNSLGTRRTDVQAMQAQTQMPALLQMRSILQRMQTNVRR